MKKSILKTGSIEREHFIDITTGEVVATNQKSHTYIANSKEEFTLVYSSLLGVFNDLTLGAIKVYAYLLQNYRANTPIELGQTSRIIIADYCKLQESTVKNVLKELKDKQLVYSPKVKLYYLNPRYAFKGSTSERNQSLKAIIELGCKEC